MGGSYLLPSPVLFFFYLYSHYSPHLDHSLHLSKFDSLSVLSKIFLPVRVLEFSCCSNHVLPDFTFW